MDPVPGPGTPSLPPLPILTPPPTLRVALSAGPGPWSQTLGSSGIYGGGLDGVLGGIGKVLVGIVGVLVGVLEYSVMWGRRSVLGLLV